MTHYMDKEVRQQLSILYDHIASKPYPYVPKEDEQKWIDRMLYTLGEGLKHGKTVVIDKATFDDFKRITPDSCANPDDFEPEQHRSPFEETVFVIYDHQKNCCDSMVLYAESMLEDSLSPGGMAWELVDRQEEDRASGYRTLPAPEGPQMVLYTVLCYEALVNSKSFEPVEKAALPAKLAKKRQRKQKSAFVGGYTVIEPKRYSSSEPTGNGAKKRMHLRRGHWRHLKGKTVWVNSCVVGNGELIPRDGYILKKGENYEQLPKS